MGALYSVHPASEAGPHNPPVPLTAAERWLLAWTLLACLAAPAFLLLTALWLRQRHRYQIRPFDYPPLSIIKPIKGASDQLFPNLASTLATGYPAPLELLCCVEDDSDPAVPVVRELQAAHPHHDIKLVFSHGQGSIFGKHANLIAGYRASRYDTVVCSDADVRLPGGILNELIPPLWHPQVGGSTGVFFQESGPGAGTDLMAIFVAAYGYTPNLAARHLRMLPNAIGGLMAYRKEILRAMGDFPAIIAEKISDDGALGQAVWRSGREMYLCGQPFTCVRAEPGVRAVLANIHRWMLMFKGQGTTAYFQMLLVNPYFPLLAWTLAAAAGASSWRWTVAAWLAVTLWELIWGAIAVLTHFHRSRPPLPVVLGRPLAHLAMAITWLAALVWPYTSWGGRRYVVPIGGRAKPLS